MASQHGLEWGHKEIQECNLKERMFAFPTTPSRCFPGKHQIWNSFQPFKNYLTTKIWSTKKWGLEHANEWITDKPNRYLRNLGSHNTSRKSFSVKANVFNISVRVSTASPIWTACSEIPFYTQSTNNPIEIKMKLYALLMYFVSAFIPTST